jgi:hypothetical protein
MIGKRYFESWTPVTYADPPEAVFSPLSYSIIWSITNKVFDECTIPT